jgi:hypothetical protein
MIKKHYNLILLFFFIAFSNINAFSYKNIRVGFQGFGLTISQNDLIMLGAATIIAGGTAEILPTWLYEHSFVSLTAFAFNQAVKTLNIQVNNKPLPDNQLLYLVAFNTLFFCGKLGARISRKAIITITKKIIVLRNAKK